MTTLSFVIFVKINEFLGTLVFTAAWCVLASENKPPYKRKIEKDDKPVELA
jgi:hypothetical protein